MIGSVEVVVSNGRVSRSARRSLLSPIVLLAFGWGVAGCGSSTTPVSSVAASTTTTMPDTSTTSAASTTLPAFVGGSTDPVMVPATGCCAAGPTVLLRTQSIEQRGNYYRIAFEFSGPVTNYHVRYVPLPVRQDPSDQVVELQGDKAIQISFGGTGLDQSQNPPVQTYTGPQRIVVGSGAVRELVQIGDFEAVMNWVIGVQGTPEFRVSVEQNPSQLIVEIAAA